ncbi:MAG: CofH family radical SAM protein [Planctomycetaceae bacterium]|jgi:aminodeoxyfutalosine synthase|nr:CofH family radical SAM protein [Planctomycetaceae bacterium]
MRDNILLKLASGERLTYSEGVYLFREFNLHELGVMADSIRCDLHGDNTYYVVNAHINPTNICKVCCPLCAFAAVEGDVRGYVLGLDEILRLVESAANNNVTQIHIVCSIHPSKSFSWYREIISTIHSAFPLIHIKAYTAVEIAYFSEASGKSIYEVLSELRSCGLSSLPGGGAEIFDESIRQKIAPNKISADVWLNVHRVAHSLGMVTNASMLFGHIETCEHRVGHLIRLRDLQDESISKRSSGDVNKSGGGDDFNGGGYFDCFVPLVYHGANTELSRTTSIEPISPQDILKTIAVARLILRNIIHIKSYWVTLGESLAQVALSYGADHFDGTVFEEKIHHEAGANTPKGLTEKQIQKLITDAKKIPIKKNF